MTTNISTETKQYLTFSLSADVQAMLPTHQLTEILNISVEQVVAIPDLPATIMGVCNWRGEVLWLVDFGFYLGFPPLLLQENLQATYKCIVVHGQGKVLGLVVDEVTQMIWCDTAQIQSPPANHIAPDLVSSLKGYWLAPQAQVILALDAEAVIASLQQ